MTSTTHSHRITSTATSTRALLLACLLPWLGLGLLLPGCGRAPETRPAASLAGTYTLATVNGSPLPASVTHDGAALKIQAGTFTINADGTCASKVTFVPPSGVESTREVQATYVQEGTELKMQWKGAGRTTGTVAGNTFTMNNEGMALVFKK